MIRRALIAVMLGGLWLGVQADAADVPFSTLGKPAKHVKARIHRVPVEPVAASKRLRNVVIAPQKKLAKPARDLDAEAPVAIIPQQDIVVLQPAPAPLPDEKKGEDVAPSDDMELSWFLEPLVANADGPKGEASASTMGNLIIAQPGYASGPHMEIELSGHIVKTPDTTVRVDVQVGKTYRSLVWSSEEVKSGRFSVSFKAQMRAGKLPGHLPVSALAFVTRHSKQGVAMVSVEKVTVRIGGVSEVAAQ